MDYFKGPAGRKRLIIIGAVIAGLLVVIWYVKNHNGNNTGTSSTDTSGISGSGNGITGMNSGWGGVIDVISSSTPSAQGSTNHAWGGATASPYMFGGHHIQPAPQSGGGIVVTGIAAGGPKSGGISKTGLGNFYGLQPSQIANEPGGYIWPSFPGAASPVSPQAPSVGMGGRSAGGHSSPTVT